MKNRNSIYYIFFLIAFTFIVLEILLRIIDPFHLRLRGDKIVLPVNQVYSFSNLEISKLDKKIIHTKNSLGFRGEELPAHFENYLSVITVGGSTTECLFIPDKHDWTFLLGENLKNKFNNLWINNAGLEGHSTYGHQVLLNDFIVHIRPKVILFLTGINDVGIEKLRSDDNHNLVKTQDRYIITPIARHSEVLNLLNNFLKSRDAVKTNLTNKEIDLLNLDTLLLSSSEINKNVFHQIPLALAYKSRVVNLIDTCLKNNIEPVFITQPALYGFGKDPVTGVDLETIKVDEKSNGKNQWQILQLYNDQVRSLCKEKNIFLIDLADEMPKSSDCFYDLVHFTNKGCEKVAEIISNDLNAHLKNKYAGFSAQNK